MIMFWQFETADDVQTNQQWIYLKNNNGALVKQIEELYCPTEWDICLGPFTLSAAIKQQHFINRIYRFIIHQIMNKVLNHVTHAENIQTQNAFPIKNTLMIRTHPASSKWFIDTGTKRYWICCEGLWTSKQRAVEHGWVTSFLCACLRVVCS